MCTNSLSYKREETVSGETEKVGFESFVLRAKFWARRGILVGKRIISELLRSSEAAVALSNTQFWA